MWWLIWIVTILMVIGTKVYTGRTLVQMRFVLADLQKRVAKSQKEEQDARQNLEGSRRHLAEVRESVGLQREANQKLAGTILALEEARDKRLEETRAAEERIRQMKAAGGQPRLTA